MNFESWLQTLPLSVQANIKAGMEKKASYTADAFNAGLEAAAQFMEARKVTASPFYGEALRKLKVDTRP